MATRRRWRSVARATRVRWMVIVVGLVSGLLLWAVGIHVGIVLAGVSAIGFVVAAWWDIGPRGGHVHDDGMVSRGVSEGPRFPK